MHSPRRVIADDVGSVVSSTRSVLDIERPCNKTGRQFHGGIRHRVRRAALGSDSGMDNASLALRERSYRRIRQLATGERVTLVARCLPRELIAGS